MTTLKIQSPTALATAWQRFRRSRSYLFVMVGLVALLAGSVAMGQSSQNYDLACRSVMTGGGGTITGGNYGVIAALGMPIVPPAEGNAPTYSVRSTNYALRAGFLPGYPTSTAITAESPTIIDQVNRIMRLPIVFKEGRFVRGGC